jgi:hypothetical protein
MRISTPTSRVWTNLLQWYFLLLPLPQGFWGEFLHFPHPGNRLIFKEINPYKAQSRFICATIEGVWIG